MLSRPWKRALLVLGLGLVLGGVAVAASAARVASLSSGRVFASEDVPERGVGLVLGARSHPDRPSAFLAARLDVAVDLFQRGKVRVLLVSGDNLARSNHETAMMRRYLEERGVPPEAVFEDEAGFDTYDSCVRARRIFGVSRAIVVTQTYHLPRALATCRAIGLDAWGVGDETVKTNQQMWLYGSMRELGANLKMAWDVLSQRQPTLGPRETGVDDALRA